MARHAFRAIAAENRKATDHVVARLDVGDLAADLFDYSGGFVAEHGGGRGGIETVYEMEVAMAYAAGNGLNQDFAILRLVELDVRDTEGQLGPMENCGFHSECSPCRRYYGCARTPIFRARASAMANPFTTTLTAHFQRNQRVAYGDRLWKNDLSGRAGDRDTREMRRGRIRARVEARPRVAVEQCPIFARVHEFACADIGRDQYIICRKSGDSDFGAGLTVVECGKDLQDL